MCRGVFLFYLFIERFDPFFGLTHQGHLSSKLAGALATEVSH